MGSRKIEPLLTCRLGVLEGIHDHSALRLRWNQTFLCYWVRLLAHDPQSGRVLHSEAATAVQTGFETDWNPGIWKHEATMDAPIGTAVERFVESARWI